MSTSLLDLSTQYLTPDVMDRLATFTGESPVATTRAFAGAAPAVIAGMATNAGDTHGLAQLVNLFQQGKFDGSMLDNLAGAYSGSSLDGLMRTGGPLLGSLFGARSAALVDAIAGYAGVKRTSAMSILSAAAPFVMSLVGRQLLSQGGISANALRNLLADQQATVASAVPPAIGAALTSTSPAGAARVPAGTGTRTRNRLVPIVIGIVLLLVLAWALRTCGRSPAITTPPSDTTQTMAPAAPPRLASSAA